MRRALLSLTALSGVAVCGGCATSTPTPSSTETGYYATLRSLTDGGDLTEQARRRVMAGPTDQLDHGMAGLRFGMTMDEVVAVWGRPSSIWMMGDRRTQLSIAHSTFEFVDNSLVSIDVHRVDLPGFALGGGQLALGAPPPDLASLFPGALTTTGHRGDHHEVQLPSGVIVNAYAPDGEIISITLEKR